MASARQAQLLEQRRKYSGFSRFGETRRILNPNSLSGSLSSIARKSLDAEFVSMKKQYDDGLISNEDMRAFVQKYSDNALLTPQEKVSAADTLRDLDVAIDSSKVESSYKLAPNNTQQRADAAKAVAGYYGRLAGGMIPGTPAHSKALEKIGQWTQAARAEQDTVNKLYRQKLRAQNDLKISQMTNGTPEELQAKVESYMQLAQEAMGDGQETEAIKYQTLAQNANDQVPILQTKNAVKTIRGQLNELADQYHDGKINEDQYLSALFEIGNNADLTGDAGLISTVNRISDQVYKNKVAGGLNRAATNDGLPVVVGKQGAKTVTNWDNEDLEFKDDMKTLNESVSSGVLPDGTPFNLQSWSNIYADVLVARQQDVTSRLESLSRKDPFDKVFYGGKKVTVESATESLTTELETASGSILGDKTEDGGLSAKIEALRSGRVVPIMVAPSEFTNAGDPRVSSKSVARIDFVDANNLPADQWTADSNGIYHKINKEKRNITPEEAAKVFNGYLNTGKSSVPVYTDASGNQYVYTGNQKVDVYVPNTSFKVSRDFVSGQPVQSVSDEEMRGFGLKQDFIGPKQGEILPEATSTAVPPYVSPKEQPFSSSPQPQQLPQELKVVAPREAPALPTSDPRPAASGQIYQDFYKESVSRGLESAPQVKMPDIKIPDTVPNMSNAFKVEQPSSQIKLATPTNTLPNINTEKFNMYLGPQGNLEQGGQPIQVPDSSKTDPANLPKNPWEAVKSTVKGLATRILPNFKW